MSELSVNGLVTSQTVSSTWQPGDRRRRGRRAVPAELGLVGVDDERPRTGGDAGPEVQEGRIPRTTAPTPPSRRLITTRGRWTRSGGDRPDSGGAVSSCAGCNRAPSAPPPGDARAALSDAAGRPSARTPHRLATCRVSVAGAQEPASRSRPPGPGARLQPASVRPFATDHFSRAGRRGRGEPLVPERARGRRHTAHRYLVAVVAELETSAGRRDLLDSRHGQGHVGENPAPVGPEQHAVADSCPAERATGVAVIATVSSSAPGGHRARTSVASSRDLADVRPPVVAAHATAPASKSARTRDRQRRNASRDATRTRPRLAAMPTRCTRRRPSPPQPAHASEVTSATSSWHVRG